MYDIAETKEFIACHGAFLNSKTKSKKQKGLPPKCPDLRQHRLLLNNLQVFMLTDNRVGRDVMEV